MGALSPNSLIDCGSLSFQSASLNTAGVSRGVTTAAVEDVMTIRLTWALIMEVIRYLIIGQKIDYYAYPCFRALSSMPTVPFTAGLMRSMRLFLSQ